MLCLEHCQTKSLKNSSKKSVNQNIVSFSSKKHIFLAFLKPEEFQKNLFWLLNIKNEREEYGFRLSDLHFFSPHVSLPGNGS